MHLLGHITDSFRYIFLKWTDLSKVKVNNLVNDYICDMNDVVVLWYLALFFDQNLFVLCTVQGQDGSTSKTLNLKYKTINKK